MISCEDWSEVCIANICESIIDCLNRTAPTVDEATPYKMIRTTNVRNGWIDLSNVKYVDQSIYERWTRRQVPKRGDIVLTREAPLGEVGMVRSNDQVFLGQRLVSYRVDPDKADNRFLLYAFQDQRLQGQIRAFGSGATVEHMRVPDAKLLKVWLPPLPTQRRIGSILSTFDDLIENNMRRIAILEEMARRLHEEWFVHYRFPGHEETQFRNTIDLGCIPDGWRVISLSEAIDFNPRTKVPSNGEKLFVPMSALSENSMVVGKLEAKSGISGAKFQNGDTLVARITPCLENGKTGFVDFLPPEQPTAAGSTEFIVLRSRSLCPEFVYLLARSDRFRDVAIKSMSGATGRQRVRTDALEELPIPQPDQDTLATFHDLVAPMFRLVRKLADKNTNLRVQRDLLLPKLVSGEIDLAQAEERAQEAAA